MTRAFGPAARLLSMLLACVPAAVGLPPAGGAQERARVEIVPSAGHTRLIDIAAFSPDGTRILSAGGDGALKLWEAATGRLLQSFEGDPGRASVLSLSPDGSQVLSNERNTLKLWDVATGQHIGTLKDIPISLSSAAFSPDGRSVLVGSSNGTVQLRDPATGRTVRVFRHDNNRTRDMAVAFSPDGARVLTAGGGEKLVKVWETATGRLIQAFGEARENLFNVRLAVSPDGTRAVVGDGRLGDRGNGLTVFDLASGTLALTLGGPGDWRAMEVATFTRDGTRVVAGGLGWVRTWDAKSGRLLHAFDDDSLRRPAEGRVHAISPDGTYAVSGGRTLTLWDATTGQPVRDYVGLARPVVALAASPDGNRVLTGSIGGIIGVWDAATGMPVQQGGLQGGFRARRTIAAVAFTRDGARAVSRDGLTLEMWDAGNGQKLRSLEGYSGDDTPVALSPDGASIASGSELSARVRPIGVWDASTGRSVRKLSGHDDNLHALAFSPDGSRIASGGNNGEVKIWDLATRRLVHVFQGRGDQEQRRGSFGQTNAVTALAFSPDARQVLSAGHDGARLNLWDVDTGQAIRSWEAQPQISALAFSPDGSRAVSGGADAKLQLWEAATGRLVHTFARHAGPIAGLVFSSDGRRIFSGSHDGTTGVWDAEGGSLLATMIAREGGEWLTVTPEGFFDAPSPAAAKGVLAVVRGFDTYGIDPFIAALHRPDLVRAKLGGDPDGRVRQAAAGLDLDALLDNGRVPRRAPAAEAQAGPQAPLPVNIVPQMGHSSGLSSVAYAADGRLVASGSHDNTVKLWDAATGRELRTFAGHSQAVKAVAFAPNGRFLLSGSEDTTLKLWDLASGRQVRSFTGHSGWVTAAAISPDSRFALSGADVVGSARAGQVKLWDIATGRALRTFNGHSDGVEAVAFSPDGRLALSGGKDRRVKVWDLAAGQELRSFPQHGDRVHAVAFSPDGRLALSGSEDTTMKLWDVSSGRELRSFAHDSGVTSVAFAPDGDLAISAVGYDRLIGHDGTSTVSNLARVKLWDLRTGAAVRTFAEPGAPPPASVAARIMGNETRVAFSPDGRLALSNVGSTMLHWEVATGKLVGAFVGRGSRVGSVAFSPDGRLAVSAGIGDALHLWDVATGRALRSFGQAWLGTEVAFSPDGRFVLAGAHSDVDRRLMDSPAGSAVALSPDGRLALTGSGLKLELWETATGAKVRDFFGATAAAKPDDTAIVWDVATGKDLHRLAGHKGWVTSVAFSPDGRQALTGSRDHTVKLWDLASGKELRSFDLRGGHFMFQGVEVAFLGGRYALSGTSGGLVAWDIGTGEVAGAIRDANDRMARVAFSADGSRAVSVGNNGTISLWDMTTGKELRSFAGHASRVESLAVSGDGRLVLSGGNDGTARVWDTGTGRELARLTAGYGGDWVAMTPEGFFSSAQRDTGMLSLVRGVEATTIGQIYQSLFNPDLVREALAGDADGAVKSAAEAVNLAKVIDSGPPPSVAILSPEPGSPANADLVTVTARIEDRGKGVGRIEWRVNGVTAGVSTAPAGPGVSRDVRQTLALDPGENRIEAIAYERRNLLASLPARTTVTFRAPDMAEKPKLHILAIGINDYVDQGAASSTSGNHFPPLKLAVSDARTFAAAMRKAGAGLYGEVLVTEAIDDAATAAELDRAVSKMSTRIGPRDTFVLFAAAHGTSRDGRFYLIPQDYQGGSDPKALAERAIDQERLRDWVANRVKARRAIILLDTCESGALVSGYAKSRTDVPASEAAIGRLHEATGRPVLTAAATGKPAFEGYRGHGVFTYAAMEALWRGDSSGNGIIEVSELVAHVQARVPQLSGELEGRGISLVMVRGSGGDKQSAHFGSTGEDFPLVRRMP